MAVEIKNIHGLFLNYAKMQISYHLTAFFYFYQFQDK